MFKITTNNFVFFIKDEPLDTVIARQLYFDNWIAIAEPRSTLQQLQEIFQQTLRNNVWNDCDEVYTNLFVGNKIAAENVEYLKEIGITHVLNLAVDVVLTGANFYKDLEIEYLGVSVNDSPDTKIDSHFEAIAKFINNGLCGGGKVLVHCLMGYSRSATCAIAYLMICEGMSAAKACETVKSKHMCRPNIGFLRQLIDLESLLSEK